MDRKFQNIVNQLCKSEQEIVAKNKIDNLEKLIPLLLKRVPYQNSDELIKTIMEALRPSMPENEDDEFNNLFEKLTVNPKLIFESKTLDEIKSLIDKRVTNDKKNLIKKTSDVSSFITSMKTELDEAISFSGTSSKAIHDMKEQIVTVNNECDKDLLNEFKEQLINISTNIENEMCKVTANLKDRTEKISELQKQIDSLEGELKRTKTESKTDYLTGLLTRRAFDEESDKFESRFVRDGDKFAVVFFDLDHFKKINDKYGHEGGDVVLYTFAKILDKGTRKTDILCRYGGEEFVALIHYKDKKEVIGYVNRVKTIIDSNSFVYNQNKIKVRFSAGISFREENKNFKDSLRHADDKLYEAKESGRNQIKY